LFSPIAEKDGGGRSLRRRAEILKGKGGRRPLGRDHRAIVALVADVARHRQLRVGRSELLAVLWLNCPVDCRPLIFDRRRDQIGNRQIPIRQDLGNVGEVSRSSSSSACSRQESDTRTLRYR
jgi:hypothetical protein